MSGTAWALRALKGLGINAIYTLGDDYVLRVPKRHPGCLATVRREALR